MSNIVQRRDDEDRSTITEYDLDDRKELEDLMALFGNTVHFWFKMQNATKIRLTYEAEGKEGVGRVIVRLKPARKKK